MEQDMLSLDEGGVLALYRADNQTNPNNTLGLYVTAWPLLYVNNGAVQSRSVDLAARAVSEQVLPLCHRHHARCT